MKFPAFEDIKYFQQLKNDNIKLSVINEYLIDLIESKNNILGRLLEDFPDTEDYIQAHKNYDELKALGLKDNIRERIRGL